MLFAAMTGIVLFCVGIGLDYARSVNLSTDLQKAADAAALAAAEDPYRTESEVVQLAKAFLAANVGRLVTDVEPVASVTKVDGEVKVLLSARMPTAVLQLFGYDSINVGVEAVASNQTGELEIYTALDMSGSLSLAADAANRAAMETASVAAGATEKCMFACHLPDSRTPPGVTYNQIARNAGILLRDDVLASAFGSFVDTFMSTSDQAVAANKKRMAVIGFSGDAQLLLAPNNNSTLIKLAPASFPENQRWSTQYDVSLPSIRTMVGTQGSGFQGSPRKMLLLITDGVYWNWSPRDGALDAALCDSFKNDGIQVAVLDVKYYEAVGEWYFENAVRPFYANVSPALQACASPGLYFQAVDSDPPTMAAAFVEVAKALRTKLAIKQ